MREIKFRGKIRNGKWVYGYAAKFAHDSVPVILEDTENGITPRKIIPDTLGQFTGLHDKNGKEIYEGDLLRGFEYPFYDSEKDFHNYYALVEWDEEAARFYAHMELANGAKVRGISQGIEVDMEKLREMEVIGYYPVNAEQLNK